MKSATRTVKVRWTNRSSHHELEPRSTVSPPPEPATMAEHRPLLLRVPELTILLTVTLASYAVIAWLLWNAPAQAGAGVEIAAILFGSFVLSVLIAIVAVIGGVGGAVIFTPVVLGFTNIDTLVVRATGLIVAMFSGLVSSGPLMRSGLADIKLVMFGAIPIIVGAMAGAHTAIEFAGAFGERGDAIVRLLLGIAILGVAFLFVAGGKQSEYPNSSEPGRVARLIGLYGWYWDVALSREVHYKVRRGRYGVIILIGVGFIGGFFGLGGGWAVVPVFNLMMYVPLKLAAGCSGVLLAIGNASAIWPYIMAGAVIPLFAAPWMLGQVVGGIIGAHLLASVRAELVRNILIVLLVLTSLKLLARGVEGVFGVAIPLF